MAAWTASRPCWITGRAGPPVVAARVMRRAAIRWARMVSRRIASAIGPVTGAMVAARSSRLPRICWPDATVKATDAGCPSMAKGTPSGGQHSGLAHRYDQ